MTERLFISLACSKGDSLRPGPASARCCHVIYLCLDGRRKTGPFAWIEGQYLGLNCSLSNLSFTSATNLRLIIVIPRTMRNPMNAYNSLAILCCQKKSSCIESSLKTPSNIFQVYADWIKPALVAKRTAPECSLSCYYSRKLCLIEQNPKDFWRNSANTNNTNI